LSLEIKLINSIQQFSLYPKISIITATYNSAATVKDTLESVSKQTYQNIEHIIVDGLSKDNTVAIAKQYNVKIICEKDKGLYDAINKGIKASTGDVVGILNSDDFFPNENVISKVADAFEKNNTHAVYGNIAFVKPENLNKIIRQYNSAKFTLGKFKYGYMPAHPSFYAKKSCFEQYGYYYTDYKIAADYELLMRFMYTHKITSAYINENLVYMRTGGVSNQNLKSRYILNKEIVKACKANNVNTNMALLSLKYINKIGEFIKPRIGVK
jgi:glycosyltransferase involved in cell wall biosynthesis